ncbi:MAG TPA: ECF-type sigma factor [Phycisphaerales bacterium]|jgi:RNA polymerase sigma factor (TIGR02999 family)|nr:ECF-type sigma factor [Phycisphaerales bacterium]
MEGDQQVRITRLLDAAGSGDSGAASALWSEVNQELRSMATGLLARERPGATLQPTMVVNEVFLRMWAGKSEPPRFKDRRHFFGSAARVMGQFLVDHARSRDRLKRGGGRRPVSLAICDGELSTPDSVDSDEIACLLGALTALELEAPRKAEVAWLRYVAGLSIEQVATVLEVSRRTVIDDWGFAQAWLRRRLAEGGSE